MSHDANQAQMRLKHDRPALEFLGVGRQKHLEKLNDLMRKMTNSHGGTLIQNPFYAELNQQEVCISILLVIRAIFILYETPSIKAGLTWL